MRLADLRLFSAALDLDPATFRDEIVERGYHIPLRDVSRNSLWARPCSVAYYLGGPFCRTRIPIWYRSSFCAGTATSTSMGRSIRMVLAIRSWSGRRCHTRSFSLIPTPSFSNTRLELVLWASWVANKRALLSQDSFPSDFFEHRLFFLRKRERHALVFGLKEGDDEGIGLAKLKGLAQLRRRLKLGDVYQARNPLFNRGQGTVLVVLDDNSGYLHVLLVASGGPVPRVLLQGLYGERDLAVLDINDLHLHALAHGDEGMWVFNEAPVELADMNEALKPLFELDEDAEVHDAGDLSRDHVAHLVLINKRGLLLGLVAGALGEDELALLGA